LFYRTLRRSQSDTRPHESKSWNSICISILNLNHTMKVSTHTALSMAMAIIVVLATTTPFCHSYTVQHSRPGTPLTFRVAAETTSTTMMMSAEDAPDPTSFREAEVLGLRLMQEGNFDEALVGTYDDVTFTFTCDGNLGVFLRLPCTSLFLCCFSCTTHSFLLSVSALAFQKGMKLPGSRPDVLRTKSLSGPSPVGGAFGGTESQNIMSLDDFELQAAHYNMACAHARLGNLDDVSTEQNSTVQYSTMILCAWAG